MSDDVKTLAAKLPRMSYFQILGLPHRFQSDADVKRAFHVFAQLYHPDQFMGDEDDVKKAASEVFKRGVEAYEVLRHDALQKRYVRDFLTKGFVRLPPGSFNPTSPDAPPPSPPKAKDPPPKPIPETWIDELETDEGKEVGRRIDKMLKAGRVDAARQQLAILADIEPNNRAIRRKEALLKRLGERG